VTVIVPKSIGGLQELRCEAGKLNASMILPNHNQYPKKILLSVMSRDLSHVMVIK
jgi:hypothetical protein